jgi:hypothetical protein
MHYESWWRENSELRKAGYTEQPEIVNDGLSSSQSQSNYDLSSAPLTLDEDLQPVVTQHHLMCGDGSTSDNQMHAPAHIHDAEFFQNRFTSDMVYPLPESDQGDIYITHSNSPFSDVLSANNMGYSSNVSELYPQVIEGHHHPVHDNQSEFHASDYLCKWNDDGRGPCNMTVREEKEVAGHMSSFHLPPFGRYLMECKWEGCPLPDSIRRDTINRHIRQIHLNIKRRRQS